VTWTASDPDGDPTWVTVFANHEPVLDGNEQLLGSTVNTDGAQGFAVINTAELEHGTYWVYCAVTDGGTLGGSWSRGTVTLVEGPTAVAPMAAGIPPVARLLPAAPSPFNARTTLKLELTAAARLTWAIHDARGRRVRSLVEGWLPRGWHVLVWDGYDDAGLAVSSGVYYQVVESERLRDREKLLLIK
jgi:hypothetical protein